MAENPKVLQAAAVNALQRVLAAYGSQGCPIGDSDLADAQPMSLRGYLTLGDIRMARRFVLHEGARPADFDTKPAPTKDEIMELHDQTVAMLKG